VHETLAFASADGADDLKLPSGMTLRHSRNEYAKTPGHLEQMRGGDLGGKIASGLRRVRVQERCPRVPSARVKAGPSGLPPDPREDRNEQHI
jgi:hypothetical protein